MSHTKQFQVWVNMLNRCLNKRDEQYHMWGGRGITVCERWMSFAAFWEDMGPTYTSGLTLERVHNDKGYSRDNCRWATRQEQSRNRRTSIWVESPIGPLVLKDFWRFFCHDVSYGTLINRYHKGLKLLT